MSPLFVNSVMESAASRSLEVAYRVSRRIDDRQYKVGSMSGLIRA